MTDSVLSDHLRSLLSGIKNPVRLVLFTKDMGCELCPGALALAQAVRAASPKIGLEVYDQVMDRDKADQYGATNVPAFIVQGGNGRLIRFIGQPKDIFRDILVDAVVAASENRVWFPDNIRRTLGHLEKEVGIQVFVESDCSQCKPVAETAIGLAFESDLIVSDIIIAGDFPDLIRKYSIRTLPKTLFGQNLHMDGHVSEAEFLEMIFQAEGVQAGPDRRCMSCGKPATDVICTSCKTRIQAEAVEHKRKGERIASTQ